MALTPKQERNGIPAGDVGGNSSVAQPGPVPDAGPLMSQAEAAAAQVMGDRDTGHNGGEAHDAFVSGVAGSMVGAHGDMFAWDAGLAINDVEGGGSG